MLSWAVTFLIVALLAAMIGYGGIVAFAVNVAQIVFFAAITLFVIAALLALARDRSPTLP